MRKIYTIILSLVLLTNIYGYTYVVKVGNDSDFLNHDDIYFDLGLDIYGESQSIFQPGLGMIFAGVNGGVNNGNGSSGISTRFDRLPVYGIAKINLPGIGESIFFVKGFGGYEFITDGTVEGLGGLYYGHGLGIEISTLVVEYYITKESYTLKNNVTVNNSFGTIGVGIKF